MIRAVLVWLCLLCASASAQILQTGAGQSAPGSGAGCTAATTFIARTTGMSNTEITAYTSGICYMIANGVGCSAWSGSTGNLDALYIFSTNTTTTANLNLCSTSYGLTEAGGVNPVFAVDLGYMGNASGYLQTGFTPSTAGGNTTLNSAQVGFYLTNSRAVANTGAMIGTYDGVNITQVFPLINNGGPNFQYDLNDSSGSGDPVNANVQGSWLVSRTAAGAVAAYKNETLFDSTVSQTSSALPSQPYYILARNLNGSSNAWSDDTITAAWYGGGVNATQAAAIQHGVNLIMTGLSINVY